MNEESAANVDPSLTRSPWLLDRKTSALLVVDVQEKLAPFIQDSARVIWNIGRLIQGAAALHVPVEASEQYPTGLGNTVEPLRSQLKSVSEKRMFSCRECQSLTKSLADRSLRQVVVVGIETHVCVLQTALDLQSAGFDVFVAADAVGSRFELDYQIALQRMSQSGVIVTSTESVLFEWCESSAAAEFKQISQLIRQPSPA